MRYRVRPTLPGTPDLVFVRERVAVFVDGCFWHGCPEHYTAPKTNAEFWRQKVDTNRNRDSRADAQLRQLGWHPMRLWEHAIIAEVDEAVRLVLATLRAASPEDAL